MYLAWDQDLTNFTQSILLSLRWLHNFRFCFFPMLDIKFVDGTWFLSNPNYGTVPVGVQVLLQNITFTTNIFSCKRVVIQLKGIQNKGLILW